MRDISWHAISEKEAVSELETDAEHGLQAGGGKKRPPNFRPKHL